MVLPSSALRSWASDQVAFLFEHRGHSISVTGPSPISFCVTVWVWERSLVRSLEGKFVEEETCTEVSIASFSSISTELKNWRELIVRQTLRDPSTQITEDLLCGSYWKKITTVFTKLHPHFGDICNCCIGSTNFDEGLLQRKLWVLTVSR